HHVAFPEGGGAMRSRFLVLGLLTLACAFPRSVEASHFYLSPTAGAWHWDDDAYPDLTFDSSWGFVVGGRVGYAFTQAFSGEIIGLTGTNDSSFDLSFDDSSGTSESMRLTEIALSLVVHFQSLTSTRIYPFLDLGVGLALRDGGPTDLDDQHTSFHLGGGIMWVFSDRFALRANARDAFFTDKRTSGNLTEQLTVDSLEMSLGVEFRIPMKRGGSHRPE
ncbi:MAG TPA: outer membrane beta-barrel protein, partial [Candidatus Eisenbacteria bacterium]|nr:outer membrane beta-barrel protein [Candidatus Eisenbacteria bacterium]